MDKYKEEVWCSTCGETISLEDFKTYEKQCKKCFEWWQKCFEEDPTLKDTSDIPVGPYCYHGTRNPNDKNYRRCPYWDFKDKYFICKLTGEKEPEKESIYLFDQVKICGVKYGDEDD